MATKSLQAALILYRSGTLTLGQAAAYAGQTNDEFANILSKYNIKVINPEK